MRCLIPTMRPKSALFMINNAPTGSNSSPTLSSVSIADAGVKSVKAALGYCRQMASSSAVILTHPNLSRPGSVTRPTWAAAQEDGPGR
jgi:hypothetical protein